MNIEKIFELVSCGLLGAIIGFHVGCLVTIKMWELTIEVRRKTFKERGIL